MTTNCFTTDVPGLDCRGRASRLPNRVSREAYVPAARTPASRLAGLSRRLPRPHVAFPGQHGGRRRTNPNRGGKKPHNDGEEGIDTRSDEKARS